VVLRGEAPADRDAVRALLIDAFGGVAEADLVDALRRDGDLAVSLVAERDGAVIGHVGLSRLASPDRSLALAPLAVARQARRQGIGAALVGAALDRARGTGAALVFVLGEPDFYARFGFSAQATDGFDSAYAGPHFMAVRMDDAIPAKAPVVFAPAFDALA
jgi:putative acetyltransferase